MPFAKFVVLNRFIVYHVSEVLDQVLKKNALV